MRYLRRDSVFAGHAYDIEACSECQSAMAKMEPTASLNNGHGIMEVNLQFKHATYTLKQTKKHNKTDLAPNQHYGLTMAPASDFVNHYSILGLSVTASRKQILETYHRRLEQVENHANSLSPSTATPEDPFEAPSTFSGTDPVSECNRLHAAYSILSHPVKKTVYDRRYLPQLQEYERECILAFCVDSAGQQKAFARAKEWRKGLLPPSPKDGELALSNEERFNRVRSPECYGRHELCLTCASMMSGEVVAAFVDGLEV